MQWHTSVFNTGSFQRLRKGGSSTPPRWQNLQVERGKKEEQPKEIAQKKDLTEQGKHSTLYMYIVLCPTSFPCCRSIWPPPCPLPSKSCEVSAPHSWLVASGLVSNSPRFGNSRWTSVSITIRWRGRIANWPKKGGWNCGAGVARR